ncbi:MAG: glycosyltransferase [Anaerolineaceae bacterium]|nr:glycosyltransferase [Anaerolineaceae bacterium]
MNIAIISYHTCPLATLGGKDTGGMNVYVRDLTRFLGHFGIHADVFTRSQNEHVPHILHDLGHGNRVVHIPAGPETLRPKEELLDYLDIFVENILNFAKKKQIHYDLIFSHYWLSGLAAIKLKQEWDIPIVHMFHTLALLKNKNARSEKEKDGEFRVKGEREVLSGIDCLIAATMDEKENLETLYSAQSGIIKIIPPGVDTARFYPIPMDEAKEFVKIPQDEKMILFVGRIEPLKGIDTLIQAISQLQQADIFLKCPHYLYIIGGSSDDKQDRMEKEIRRLQELRNNLGVNDLVIFLGSKSQDSLPYYYSAAEMVVMPSYYESFGMVALEAMACGTPVIATQVGGLQCLVQDQVTGFTVPNGDPDALEEKITALICKDELKEKISRSSASYAQSFSWKKITKKLIKTFNKTIRGYHH